MLRALNKVVNLDFDKTTHSDFDYSLYRKTSGVINFETQGKGFCNPCSHSANFQRELDFYIDHPRSITVMCLIYPIVYPIPSHPSQSGVCNPGSHSADFQFQFV